MPLPTARDLHVDAALTDFAVAYGQEIKTCADTMCTKKRVDKQSDKYFIWNKGDMFRSEMDVRADGAPAKEGSFRVSTTSYFCETYALKTKLTGRQRKNSDIDIEKGKVRYLTFQAKQKRDKLAAAAIFATGLWTSNTEQTGVTGSSPGSNQFQYFDESGSKPISVIQNQMLAIQTATGKLPNVAMMNRKVLQTLQRHDEFLQLYKYTKGGIPGEDLIASSLGLERIGVLDTVENTAVEEATATMARVFGNHILLAYIAPQPSDEDATAVTSFSWSDVDEVDENGAAIRSWYDDDRKCDWYEAEMSFDCKITANDLGVFLNGAISA